MKLPRASRTALCLLVLYISLSSTARARKPPAFSQDSQRTCEEQLKASQDVIVALKNLDSAQKKKIELLEKTMNKAVSQLKRTPSTPQRAVRIQSMEAPLDASAWRDTAKAIQELQKEINEAIRPMFLNDWDIKISCEEQLKSAEEELGALKNLTTAQQKKIEVLEKTSPKKDK